MKFKNRPLNYVNFVLILLFFGTYINCTTSKKGMRPSSSSDEMPNWVIDPAKEVSEIKYLMAVGSGDNLSDARADAMLNLAQIFRSKVEGTQNLYTEISESTRNNTDFTSKETIRLMNTVRVGASEELLNTEVLKSELGNDGSYYVLVGMNRAASEQIYKQEIANNYQKIEHNISSANDAVKIIQKLRYFKKNVLLAKINENLNQQLSIINPGSGKSEKAIDMVLKAKFQFSEIQDYSIIEIISATENEIVTNAVESVVQKEGFLVGKNNPILSIELTYNAEESKLYRDDADFVLWDISIRIKDVETNTYSDTYTANGREGAIDLSSAFKRAELSASKEIKSSFSKFLNSEFLSN